MIVQAEEQHGQGISLRLVECRQETGTPHDHESAGVAHDVHEVDDGRHHAAEDDDQHGKILVHSLEQPVKRQHEENQDNPGTQVADHAEAEEPLVSGDVLGGRGRVLMHEQLAGNVYKAQGADNGEEQVPKPGDSPRVARCAHGSLL